MRSVALGDRLLAVCGNAKRSVLLAAPFIKVGAFQRVVSMLADPVDLVCVTRWKPEEVAAGVSDLEVWNVLRKRPMSSLRLCNDLHAKYYRADAECLIGSANLTAKALGWIARPNLELLVTAPANRPELQTLERTLEEQSLPVDEGLFVQMFRAVRMFEARFPDLKRVASDEDAQFGEAPERDEASDVETWVPTLRQPQELYYAYAGELGLLSIQSRTAALRDLDSLSVPPGLGREGFDAYVGSMLLLLPTLRKIDMFVIAPRRFGAVSDYLQTLACSSVRGFDAHRVWQTIMRWLMYFLPSRYEIRIPGHSEVFQRKDADID